MKKFAINLTIVTATLITYGVITQLAGGLDRLVETTFGGWASALSIILLILLTTVFAFWQFWLAEQQSASSRQSGLYALIGVIALIGAAIIGIQWVQWSWSLLWIALLAVPAVISSWLLTKINSSS